MTAQAGGAILSSQAVLMHQRGLLRQQMRQLRRSIPKTQQQQAAQSLARQFDRCHLLRPGLRIAVYLALPGEISLHALITKARHRGCELYAPHVINTHRRQMKFVALTADSPLQYHRWGMPQVRFPPRGGISIRQLDLVLVPLVAFDAQGHRLGMGAGFYDRYLARAGLQRAWQRPRLLGVAYALQQVAHVPALPHDVAMPAVMTERGMLHTRHTNR